MDFIIDTKGCDELDPAEQTSNPVENVPKEGKSNTLISKLLEEYRRNLREDNESVTKKNQKKTSFFEEMGWGVKKSKEKPTILEEFEKSTKEDIQHILKKSVITPDFEKQRIVPPAGVSQRILKKQRKLEAESTKGKKWFGLPATEMTEEVKRDLEVLQMRSALDPKRFYKKNDIKVLPKYFQIGKVLDSPLDYNNRLTKKERKKSLVDELLADAEFNKYNKRKFKEIIQERQKTHFKAWKQAKKLKKKK